MADAARRPSLAARLAAAFVAVAVIGVATLAVVMLITTRSETRRISDRDRAAAARQAAQLLAGAYARAGAWGAADTSRAVALASRNDAVLVVRDAAGAVVVAPDGGRGRGPGAGPRAAGHRAVATAPVTVAGRRVGTAQLRFPTSLTVAEQRLRDHLAAATLVGSLIAVTIALLAAAVVGRRVTAPLRRITAAARRLRRGELDARTRDARAPGELGELARAFDDMADTLEHEASARRQVVADLSHEVRTPLAVLRGNLEELIDGIEQPTPARLGSLHEEVVRLESLVEQLDALRRAGAPTITARLEPVDLAALAACEVEALTTKFAAKGINVETRLQRACVRGDRAKLGQVISNLLANALKFAPEHGRVEITVTAGGGAARLTVSDDGRGIPAAERERVFERFWRSDSARGVAGRGIGLAVVAEIVRAHDGTVIADDSALGGARLTVTLPLQA
jgi:two-component system sensor histidine kinase BaeS